MKNRLSIILSCLLCAALAAAAVCIGAYRGWSAEREEALTALTTDGEMHALLETRAMDAANLAVVAARHLPADDEELSALRAASALMLSGTAGPEELLLADDALTAAALQLADELPGLASVQASTRDRAYVSMLTGTLGPKTGLAQRCAELVEGFNQRLTSELTGRLAMMLGVSPLPMGADTGTDEGGR